ncbi:EAL domain-containing protein, partial [Virgibacillus sp. W0181]|uniref:EAL domain-containing protein n=1 Tax=Virgibacillus sp. W0181 TaxID=3391581 RepID=UPI003F45D0E9
VLEISESEIIKDFVSFKKQLRELKIQGFLIAIDDVGKGFSDMQTMIELEADYLKLDRYFSQDLHLSTQKQSFVSFFVNYCKQNNSELILEGVENYAEMETAKSMGVPIAQGYFLGKPAPLKKLI